MGLFGFLEGLHAPGRVTDLALPLEGFQGLPRVVLGQVGGIAAVKLQDVQDAYVHWKEDRDPSHLKEVILPMESLLSHLPRVTVKDSAVDALCHGADLAVPGVSRLDSEFARGDILALFTKKGEGIALGKAVMKPSEIVEKDGGVAVEVQRVFMSPGTYPKMWKSG